MPVKLTAPDLTKLIAELTDQINDIPRIIHELDDEYRQNFDPARFWELSERHRRAHVLLTETRIDLRKRIDAYEAKLQAMLDSVIDEITGVKSQVRGVSNVTNLTTCSRYRCSGPVYSVGECEKHYRSTYRKMKVQQSRSSE